ncbi:protein LOW PSII ACCUMULATION 1, chloroplastic-like [Zingiber officinale]|uniref:protein LOW PSII ACCUMULATION 1, chloroplastic-like n=1 Tax=Zingiber officinale TaxID=94328 RepID=UPI001C4ABEF5|nr:protein LOW PSII ACCUMULATION 1, chloroplastic-like [Zingiber officinale]XP_042395570.1 protein LOW PSII ACCUMULATION 1, chloroplastic-like [Zingiber officinale]XP_042395571.1 protein LOW PSII ACCUMULATION 1, chloroplastic-like [Zingiber officinale]
MKELLILTTGFHPPYMWIRIILRREPMAAMASSLALQQHLLSGTKSNSWTSRKSHLRIRRRFIPIAASPSSSTPPSSSSSSPEKTAQTAELCVNDGLELFSKGRVKEALMQFENALTLNPNPKESQAALYNKACCHAYRGEGRQAAECLRTALRDYNLKFSTILDDPDLASFRALPEFKELQEEARLGGEEIGYGFRRDLKLISEVQAPFRGVRRFFYVALTAAAGISLFFTIPRLILAINGGEGAPDLWETAGNVSINAGGIIILVALFIWDNKKEEEQLAQISRDETLSRLPLRLSTNRIVELVQLRDTCRPVILAGKKETVSRAMEKAERFRTELLKRGVLIIPVVWGDYSKGIVEKKGFGGPAKSASSLPSIGDDFDKRTQSVTVKSRLKAEVRFKADIVSPYEWERWIRDQQKSEGVEPGDDVFIVLRLDGRVRKSGQGMPDWQEIVKELPPLEALLSKLER